MKLHRDSWKPAGFFFAVLATLVLAACGVMQRQTETAAEQAKPLTDGEIAAVMHALNQGEIRQAELALQKSNNPKVIAIAQAIIADHREMDRKTMSLAGVPNIQLQENALSRRLRQQSHATEQKLRTLSGSSFDRAYLEGQAKEHQQAIATIQQKLLPAAQSPRVREQLTAAVGTLQQHLQQAQATSKEISKG